MHVAFLPSGRPRLARAAAGASGGDEKDEPVLLRGMHALIAPAKREGRRNVITLPDSWADDGTIMKDLSAKLGLLAPHKVQTRAEIPAKAKASNATWWDDCRGYVAIGFDPTKVNVPPRSFTSLRNPRHKGMIGSNDSPLSAGPAQATV